MKSIHGSGDMQLINAMKELDEEIQKMMTKMGAAGIRIKLHQELIMADYHQFRARRICTIE